MTFCHFAPITFLRHCVAQSHVIFKIQPTIQRSSIKTRIKTVFVFDNFIDKKRVWKNVLPSVNRILKSGFKKKWEKLRSSHNHLSLQAGWYKQGSNFSGKRYCMVLFMHRFNEQYNVCLTLSKTLQSPENSVHKNIQA